jgi:AbiV family abortive infection protein
MKLSTPYRGFLTYEQIAAGMSATKQNASRLAEDADLLLEARRFPTAASLALLSLEESDKSRILRGMVNVTAQQAIVEQWKSYRRHIDKHSLTLLLDRFSRGARRLSEFSDCVTDKGTDEKQIYGLVKQLGFYTDCLGNAHWSIPLEVIDEGLATALVRSAKIMSKGHIVWACVNSNFGRSICTVGMHAKICSLGRERWKARVCNRKVMPSRW